MTNQAKTELLARKTKLQELKRLGVHVYPDKFEKNYLIKDALKLKLGEKNIKIAGRIVARREMGKITFCHLLDGSGKMQVVFREDEVGEKAYKQFNELIDVGDFLGAAGELFATQKGEVSVLVKHYTFLGKALRPLPEKWHGLKDQELKYRKRYLDLIANPETKKRFELRSDFVKILREFYWSEGFIELETPILANTASGALARPFITHHNAMDIDMYLRISCGETWQKVAIVGGFEKTFEIGKVFRNEGMDPSHLQEFTMVEHYAAYWNFADNMKFTEDMFSYLLKKLFGKMRVSVKDKEGKVSEIDFTPPWPRIGYLKLLQKDCGIDVTKFHNANELLEEIKRKKLYEEEMKNMGVGNLIDALYKKTTRPKIQRPTFLIHSPLALSPLARKNDTDEKVVDRFHLIVNGWEIVNAYSELIDPVDQKMRFSKQSKEKKSGDQEAHGEDNEYVEALEQGAPPISGWGMGIDRIVALLTGQENLRDVVLFPVLKPE